MLHWHDANPTEPRKHLTAAQRDSLDKVAKMRDDFFKTNRMELGIEDETPKILVERGFLLCDEDGIPLNPEVPGHPDHIQYFPNAQIAVIFDDKFGRLPVPKSEINMQLKSYLVMFSELYPVKKGVVAICQPWMKEPDDFHSAIYTEQDITDAKIELIAVVRTAQQKDAPLRPSLDACRYCKAKAHCKPAMDLMAMIAETRINEVTIPELEALSDVISLSVKVAEAWVKRMKLIASTMPDLLKHHKLGTQQYMRTITDAHAAFNRLFDADLLGPDDKEAMQKWNECLKASLPSVVDLVSAQNSMPEAEADTAVESALAELIEKKPKERSLVKI